MDRQNFLRNELISAEKVNRNKSSAVSAVPILYAIGNIGINIVHYKDKDIIDILYCMYRQTHSHLDIYRLPTHTQNMPMRNFELKDLRNQSFLIKIRVSK